VRVSLDAITREAGGARTSTRAVLRKFFRKQPWFILTRGGFAEGEKKNQQKTKSKPEHSD